jgi:hypothetical protein
MVYGKRATPYEALSAFSDQLAAAEDLLPRAARVLAEATGPARRCYVTPTRVPRDGLERVGRCAAIAVARLWRGRRPPGDGAQAGHSVLGPWSPTS